MDLKSTYNTIAKDWSKDHMADNWWHGLTNKFLSYLRSGDKILDIGCGAGVKTKYLSEKGFEVVGIDLSEEMIEIAKEYCPKASYFVKDIKEPINLGVFDGIFAQAVLLHIPKSEIIKVLQSLNNSLKSGGHMYMAVKELKPGEKEEQNIIENDYGHNYERFFSFFTVDEMKDNLTSLNMKILHAEVVPRGDTNWIVVIAKKH